MSFRSFAGRLARYGLLAAALAATAGLSALATMRVVLMSQEVRVPDLVGKRVPEAGTLAARSRLQLRVEGKRNDSRIPMDAIISQEPPAGATLKTSRSIRVWLSLGPRRIQVPAVQGESLRTGRLTLEQAGVPVARVAEVQDISPEGTILLQRPTAGETDSVGPGASLLVSLGPVHRDYVMPDLIGRKADEVVPALQQAGLRVGDLRQRTYPGVEPGIVLRQLPPSGHRVSSQVLISLDVSRAAESQ